MGVRGPVGRAVPWVERFVQVSSGRGRQARPASLPSSHVRSHEAMGLTTPETDRVVIPRPEPFRLPEPERAPAPDPSEPVPVTVEGR